MYELFDNDRIFVLGHRGYSEKYPENTMESFQACADIAEVDGVELDVHLCKSGELVVAHDGNLKRCAGIDRFIEDMTWDELKDIDVGSFKDPKFSSCRMPLLEELFETFGTRFCYDIEIKVEKGRPYRKVCAKTWDLIQKYQLESNVMVSSFNPFALRRFNRLCWWSVPTADIYNIEKTVPKVFQLGWGHTISGSSYMKPSVAIAGKDRSVDYNLPIISWTVNDLDTAISLLKLKNCKGLIGNNPEILVKSRDKFNKK